MPTLLANACSEDNADFCSDICQTLSSPKGGHDGLVISHIRCHVQVWNMALGVTDILFPDTCLLSPPWLSSLVLGISYLLHTAQCESLTLVLEGTGSFVHFLLDLRPF